MQEGELKASLGKRLAWVGAASSAVAVLDVVALVLILKFWVGPDVLGVATVVVTLFGALELAAELGLSAAVIQRDGHTQEQLSTIFWMNILFGVLFYAAIYAGAPLMARLHDSAVIEDLFKVFGLNLLLRSLYSMYQAQIKKQLRFRELSIVRIVANVFDFVAKIAAAYAGLEVWCFVVGHLARSLVFCIGLPIVLPWRPRLVFRPREAMGDLAFGARSASSEILFQIYSNLDYQIVHLYFGATALGLYRAAYELVLEPVRFVSGIVVAVAFPAVARVKHSLAEVADLFISFCKQNLIVVLSLVSLILVSAEDLLQVFFKDEYAGAADAARILALVGVLRALSYLGPPLLDGLGRPDLTLRYQVAATTLTSLSFWTYAELLGARLNYVSVAVAWAIGYPLAFLLLARLVFAVSEQSFADFLGKVWRIPLAIGLAALLAVGMRFLAATWPPGWRLLSVSGVLFAAILVLLSAFEGINPRSVLRSLRS